MAFLTDLLGIATSALVGCVASPLPERAGERPVVLLHGFASNARILIPLERALRARLGRPVLRVELGPGLADVRESAGQLVAALREIADCAPDGRVDVVGHSLGGLVATYALKRLDRGRRIRRVVTLGTPHRGVPAALAGVLLLGIVSRSMWQLVPGSRFLRTLARRPVPLGCELISLAAGRDRLVPPRWTRLAAAPRQLEALLDDDTHLSLLVSPAVAVALGERLEAPFPLRPAVCSGRTLAPLALGGAPARPATVPALAPARI